MQILAEKDFPKSSEKERDHTRFPFSFCLKNCTSEKLEDDLFSHPFACVVAQPKERRPPLERAGIGGFTGSSPNHILAHILTMFPFL